MILELIEVVLPVFLVIGAGFAAVRFAGFKDTAVDGLMNFTQNYAIPCLLFIAVVHIDLATAFEPGLILSFYTSAAICFALGIFGARALFDRRPGEAVAIGFSAFFSNSVLLGLPIMERAYGPDSLGPNYAIISLHAPFCYGLGIAIMEVLRADGRRPSQTARLVGLAVAKNALMLAIVVALACNLTGIMPPPVAMEALDLMGKAALPAALFGLGGILSRYRLREQLGEVGLIGLISLIVHPTLTYFLTVVVFALPDAMVRSAVLTAAMAPGANTYIFSAMYGRAMEVTSAAVLLLTVISLVTVTFWLMVLP